MTETQIVWTNGILLAILLLVLYFFFLRPDRKERQQKDQVQSQLKTGDQVYTRVGIHGTVTAINGDLVLLQTGRARTELEVLRSAILTLDGAEDTGSKHTRTIPINRE